MAIVVRCWADGEVGDTSPTRDANAAFPLCGLARALLVPRLCVGWQRRLLTDELGPRSTILNGKIKHQRSFPSALTDFSVCHRPIQVE